MRLAERGYKGQQNPRSGPALHLSLKSAPPGPFIMKFSLLAIVALASTSLSQSTEDPGPSPTASAGCEPHGDHW